jgi:peptide deformylase
MAVREILLYPDDQAALRTKSEPVPSLDSEARRLILDLKETLDHHPEGIGLAAPQINVHSRVIVVRLGTRPGAGIGISRRMVLLNPVILEAGCEKRDFDGCLSFPGLYGETVRPHHLRVAGLDEDGVPLERNFTDFDAVLVHHEIDHLEGMLFIDRIERMQDLYRIVPDEQGRPVRRPVSLDLEAGSRYALHTPDRGLRPGRWMDARHRAGGD